MKLIRSKLNNSITNNSLRASAGDVFLEEWRLVYSPKCVLFERLTNSAARALGLVGVVGVDDPDGIRRVMLDRELVAGIEFKHPAVRILI